jgi:hypothetical protein
VKPYKWRITVTDKRLATDVRAGSNVRPIGAAKKKAKR